MNTISLAQIVEAMTRLSRYLMEDAAKDKLSDSQVVACKVLLPEWKAGEAFVEKDCRRYQGKAYRCRQGHTSQEGWEPDKAPALWAVIDKTHAGTPEDPISASRGMDYEYGKYYLDPEDQKLYLCKRGEETGTINLQYLPHEVAGQYFEEVETL